MNSVLGISVDRAVERERERRLAEMCYCPECPECGGDLDHVDGEVYVCECGAQVEFYGPEEDAPKGGCIVTFPDEEDG